MSDLPKGWLETQLGEVVSYGETIKVEPAEIESDAWILELEDIEKDTSKILQKLTFSDRASKSTKNRFNKGDVLYGKLRPYLNKLIIADSPGYCSTEIIPIKPNIGIEKRFLFYSLKRKEFQDYVNEISHGLNMPRLGTKQGQMAPLRLAPLKEQTRITKKLDQLLAKVDAAKARLDKIPAILKRFRQSVLAAATSGRLTEEWREEHPTISWKSVLFDEILLKIEAGKNIKCDERPPAENEYGIVKISSVTWGEFNEEESKTLVIV